MFNLCLICPWTHPSPLIIISLSNVAAKMFRSSEAVCLQAGCRATLPAAEPDKKEIAELAAFPVPVPRGHLCNSWACIIYQLVDSMWGGEMEAERWWDHGHNRKRTCPFLVTYWHLCIFLFLLFYWNHHLISMSAKKRQRVEYECTMSIVHKYVDAHF